MQSLLNIGILFKFYVSGIMKEPDLPRIPWEIFCLEVVSTLKLHTCACLQYYVVH